jgi:hypothetical protein
MFCWHRSVSLGFFFNAVSSNYNLNSLACVAEIGSVLWNDLLIVNDVGVCSETWITVVIWWNLDLSS